MMLIFALMGVLAGYVSARLYKMFGGMEPNVVMLQTALVYPGVFFATFFILNLFVWAQRSSGAVPFFTLFAVVFIWCGISVPLVLLGSRVGGNQAKIEIPTRVNQIPREIPAQPWYIGPIFTCLVGGILPFGAIFTELFFFMSSVWQHQFYHLFGFLTLVLVILITTSAEISIALTYLQLTAEDHRWLWRAFLSPASSGLYVFLYSGLYFTYRLHIDRLVSTLLYFGYMFLISIIFFLLTGSIGALASFWFVRKIYGSIKID
jgi:transmembrane 9 superfamily protein 2/4